MSKATKRPIHYSPSGHPPMCKCGKGSPMDQGYTSETWMREVRSSSASIAKVTCAECLHLVAAMMIRKGVPIQFTRQGTAFASATA